jgi:hypothetical protein
MSQRRLQLWETTRQQWTRRSEHEPAPPTTVIKEKELPPPLPFVLFSPSLLDAKLPPPMVRPVFEEREEVAKKSAPKKKEKKKKKKKRKKLFADVCLFLLIGDCES